MHSLNFIIYQIKFIYFLIKNRQTSGYWFSHSNFSHLPTLVASGFQLKKIILDSVELPDPKHRTWSRIRKYNFLIRYFYRFIDKWIGKRCYKVVTTSYSMKLILEKYYGRSVDFITNFDLDQSGKTLAPEPFTIAIPSSISSPTGLKFIANIIPHIPNHWTIKFIGQTENELKLIKSKINIKENIQFFQKTKRAEYLKLISSCSIGWVLFDTSIKNCLHCLPNRYLDMKKFNLPVIHTGNLGIQHYQLKNDFFISYNNVPELLKVTNYIFNNKITPDILCNDSQEWETYFKTILVRGKKISVVCFSNIEEKYRIKKMLIGLIKNNNEYSLFYRNNKNFIKTTPLIRELP